MKKILVVYYSQSGQLKQIADNFIAPFATGVFSIEWLKIEPLVDFPFPWTDKQFYDAMPESVLAIPMELKPACLQSDKYDLIVFAYQPWFLSPSIPATSIFQDVEFKKVLKDTPVVTLIGSRNSWIMAQKRIKSLLLENKANLIANIVFEDRNTNLISGITIQYWLYTGKKDRYLGVFPKPGVSDEDIQSAAKYGEIVFNSVQNNSLALVQDFLIVEGATPVHPNLLFVELRGTMLFNIWANIIIKKKNRNLWLVIFKYYLIIALFILSPIVLLFYTLLFRPFLSAKIKREKEFYSKVN
ncbi:MAG: hypothetical protein WCK02_16365 [Bacteroidota bacterium]